MEPIQKSDPFWFDKIEVFWQSDKYLEFFPSKYQTTKEKFNAIFRLSVYISLILYFYHSDFRYILLAVGVGLFTIYVVGNAEETRPSAETFEGNTQKNDNCTLPTLDNPFMNPTMKDYMNIENGRIIDRPPACNSSDVKHEMDDAFGNNLYMDVNDVFGKMNSQRQYYTMPSTTIPNKQDEFARWLYATPATCKEDQDYCLRYEDLRSKSNQNTFYNPNENPINTKRFEN
jgi:hypothetical protein